MSRALPTDNVVTRAVRLACRAPSIHNSQPWRWVVEGARLNLYLDRDRLVETDSSGRQALISCGAVLDHLRVAMAADGWVASVTYYPDADDHLHLATVEFTDQGFVGDDQVARADAILHRRTDRLPFAAPPALDRLVVRLRGAMEPDGAVLDVLADGVRPQLAEASQLTDSLRLFDSAYHSELHWWTAPFEVSDGIPHTSLVSAAESDRVAIGRTFPVTHHRDRRQEVPDDRAAVFVLSALADTRLDILRCGEALSAILLEATMSGMATCSLTHLTEVPASAAVVSGLTGRPLPQVLIRVGLTPALEESPPPTPRRPLSDVIRFTLDSKRSYSPTSR